MLTKVTFIIREKTGTSALPLINNEWKKWAEKQNDQQSKQKKKQWLQTIQD